MAEIPRERALDKSLSLFFDGSQFVEKYARHRHSEIYETRLMLREAICLRGQRAAEIFYDSEKFQLTSAFPRRRLKTLVSENGARTLDDVMRRHRQQILMSLLTPENVQRLVELVRLHLRCYSRRWEKMETVRLFDETEEILCRAVCEWAGVPLEEEEVKKRTKDFETLIEGGAKVGWRRWRARLARRRAENWAGKIIERIRESGAPRDATEAASLIAHYRFYNGMPMLRHTAANELLNILRRTVGAARYIIFAAHALHRNPELVEKIKRDERYFRHFLKEIRRFYPFFPFAAAIVKNDFFWNGYHFPRSRRVVLDLYATDHNAALRKTTHEFCSSDFDEESFICNPQGNNENHRHEIEQITLTLMKTAVEFLISEIEYEVPRQDLRIQLDEIPAVPESRFVIENVRIN